MTNGRSSWLKLPLLLSLLLLVPRVGLAAQDTPPTDSDTPAQGDAPVQGETPSEEQTPSTESRLPGTEESESRRLMDEESWARDNQRTGAPQGLRILGEFGAGALTAVGGGIGGGLVGLGLCGLANAGVSFSGIGCAWGAVLGSGLGVLFGYPLGVWWGGEALGGDGSLFAAVGGMAGGILAAVILGIVTAQLDASGAMTSVTTGLVFLGAPILAYELSQKRDPRQPRRGPAVASSRPRIQPLLSVSSRGAVLGLGGSF